MKTSTNVNWEISLFSTYRLHKIVIDWENASDVKNYDWDNEHDLSTIYFPRHVAIQNPKVIVFKKKIKIFGTELKNEKMLKFFGKKRNLKVLSDSTNTILKIDLNKLDKEFNLFERDDFRTIITFKEGRTTDNQGKWTYEKLEFTPKLLSTSYEVAFRPPKISFFKSLLYLIFKISDRTNYDIVVNPIKYNPDIKKNKIVILIPEKEVGIQEIYYTLPDINYIQLIIRIIGIIVIAFLPTILELIKVFKI